MLLAAAIHLRRIPQTDFSGGSVFWIKNETERSSRFAPDSPPKIPARAIVRETFWTISPLDTDILRSRYCLPADAIFEQSVVRTHRLGERAACCFGDSLGKPTRAGKRCPCQNADESFFAPIFTEDILN